MRLALDEILFEVSKVLGDFPAMRAKLAEVVAVVKADTLVEKAERQEHVEFLEWLDRNHITLLGYECLGVQHSGENVQVLEIEEARLGMCRCRTTSGASDLARDLQLASTGSEGMLKYQLTFSKSRNRSRVHRFAYPDYIEINQFDEHGQVVLQHRFMGLYTYSVYSQSPSLIPIVRLKVAQVIKMSGLDMSNHEGRELVRVMDMFPRDELFQATVEELYRLAVAINQLQERRTVK